MYTSSAVKLKFSTTASTSDKRKATPVKSKESKKKVAKSSTSSEELQELDAKWSEHFSNLEAMLLAQIFQPCGQLTFKNIQMPVSPRKVGTLPSVRPFIQPRLVSTLGGSICYFSCCTINFCDLAYQTGQPVYYYSGPC